MTDKGGSSLPQAPDPNALIQAQAQANRVSTISPFGNILYLRPESFGGTDAAMAATQRGGFATPTASTADLDRRIFELDRQARISGFESPELVQLRAQRAGLSSTGQAAAGGPPSIPGVSLPPGYGLESGSIAYLDLPPQVRGIIESLQGTAGNIAGQLNNLPALPSDFSADRDKVEKATFDRLTGLLDPRFEREARALEQRLANRGTPVGTEIYGDEMDLFRRARSEAELNAALSATLAGGQEQSRLFDLALRGRQEPFNELASLLRGAQIGGVPNISPQRIDVTGPTYANYDAQLQAYQQRQQQQQGLLGGLFGLGSAAVSNPAFWSWLSDPDAKHIGPEIDADAALEGIKKLPVHAWRYKEDRVPGDQRVHIGPMANSMAETFGVGDGKTIAPQDAFGVMMLGMKALAKRVDRKMPAYA